MGTGTTRYYVLLGVVALAVAAVLLFRPDPQEEPDYSHITSFQECQEAGHPVVSSFPPTCALPDGRSFVEDVTENSEVVLDSPNYGDTVTSPLTVSGRALGPWFFEANLPVTLKDQDGNILDQAGAQAQGEWMTEDFVEFSVVLEFEEPATEYGVLLIEKDNPSGLPEHGGSYAIPVRFR